MSNIKNENTSLIGFDENDIKFHINYEMRLTKRFGKSFEYVYDKLNLLGCCKDISDLTEINLENDIKWREGKSYDWCCFNHGDLFFIIRNYQSHFTIMLKIKKTIIDEDLTFNIIKYASFTFNIDSDKIKDDELCTESLKYNYPKDYYICDNRFHDIDILLFEMIKLIKDDGNIHFLTNSAALKLPNHVIIKKAFENETIYSIDLSMFVADEIGEIHLELYSENEMFEKVKNISELETLPENVISINSELKNEYYHGVGIHFKKESYMTDVYSLTRYHHKEVNEIFEKYIETNINN